MRIINPQVKFYILVAISCMMLNVFKNYELSTGNEYFLLFFRLHLSWPPAGQDVRKKAKGCRKRSVESAP